MSSGKPSSLLEGLEQEVGNSSSERGGRGGASIAGLDPRKVAMIVGAVGMFVVAGFLLFRSVGGFTLDAGEASRIRVAVDSETGKVFENHAIKDGESWPWKHPSTGKNTLYPAEACYWTSDGKAKLEPTYVALNSIMGKEGDTICPDCGRKVVAHNPMPPMELLQKAVEARQSGSK